MRRARRGAACGVLMALASFALPTPGAALYPIHQPVPGGIAVLEIGRGEGFEARFGRKPIMVIERGGVWFAVVGIDLDAPLGNYLITAKTADETSSLGFYIKPHSYPFKDEFQELGVPDGKGHPDAWRDSLDASFPLSSPVKAARAERFGSRFASGPRAKSVSWAVMGEIEDAEVVSPGGGFIVDVLNTDGINHFLTIDHGMGLFSCIGPVRNTAREKGQPIKRGEPLGDLGIDTARPHTLYWRVTLNGVAVNPALVSDQLPDTAAD